jgi:hypothetical protein
MKCIMQSDRNLSTDYPIKAHNQPLPQPKTRLASRIVEIRMQPCLKTDAIKQMPLQIRRLDVKLTYLSS